MLKFEDKSPAIVNNYIKELAVTRSLKPLSIEAYHSDLILFLKFLRKKVDKNYKDTEAVEIPVYDMPEDQIFAATPSVFSEYLETGYHSIYQYYHRSIMERKETYMIPEIKSPATKKRRISSITQFYKYLYRNNFIEHDPFDGIEYRVKVDTSSEAQKKGLSEKEAISLIEKTEDNERRNHIRDHCIITLFMNCGMRVSELCALNLDDVDLEERKIVLQITKGSHSRTLFLNDVSLDALKEYLAVRPRVTGKEGNALFLSSQKKRITRGTVYYMVKSYQREVPPSKQASPHQLRHTAATLMMNAGGGLKEIQDILGHANIATSNRYLHSDEENKRMAIDNNPLNKK